MYASVLTTWEKAEGNKICECVTVSHSCLVNPPFHFNSVNSELTPTLHYTS